MVAEVNPCECDYSDLICVALFSIKVDDVTYADGMYSDSDGAAVVTSEPALWSQPRWAWSLC